MAAPHFSVSPGICYGHLAPPGSGGVPCVSPKGCDTASHAPGTTRAHKSLAGHQSEKNSSYAPCGVGNSRDRAMVLVVPRAGVRPLFTRAADVNEGAPGRR